MKIKKSYKKWTYVRKTCIVIILLVIIYTLIFPVVGKENQSVNKSVTYRVSIDQQHGFYRVYYANTSGKVVPVPYNGTLNISKGDTITWMNDAVPDVRLTVINQQKLWDNNSGDLKWTYKQFSYTFNKSGIYDVHIRQYPKFRQKIVVGPIESSTNVTKTNLINTSKSLKTANSTSKSLKATANISESNLISKSSKIINSTSKSPKMVSSTNLTNMPENISEKGIMVSVKYIAILLAITTISMVYIYRRKKVNMTLQNALQMMIYKAKRQ